MSRPCETAWWQPRLAVPAGAGAPERSRGGAPVWCLALFTCVLILSPQSWIPALVPFRLALVAGVLAVAALLLDRARRGLAVLAPTTGVTIAGLLFFWGLVTIPFSEWPGGSLAFLLGPFLKTLVVFWLLAAVIDDAGRLRRICGWLFLLSLPLSMTALVHFATGVTVPEGAPGAPRIAGFNAPLTDNPNDLALMLNLMIPVGIAMAQIARGTALRWSYTALVVLAALGVIATFSRGGFLTLGAILAIFLWRHRGKGAAVAAAAALAVVAFAAAPSGYLRHMTTIADIASDTTGSAQERWHDMAASLSVAAQDPLFGAGIGMNALALNEQRGDAWRMVHNVYLQYAVDLGLPGLALFLALLARSLRLSGAARRAAPDHPRSRETSILGGAIQTSLIAFCVAAMFHPVAYNAYFFYFAGLAESLPSVLGGETAG